MSHSDDVPPDDVEFLEVGPKRGVVGALRVRRWPRLLLLWWLPGYGTVATVLAGSPSTRIEIINLATGADHPLPSRIASSVADEGWESMVWSPDSRWLFLAAHGDLSAVGSCTGEITDLSHTL